MSKAVRFLALAALALNSPTIASAETSTRSRELYAIWDLETSAPKAQVIKAVLDGMRINISRSDTITPVVLDEPPEKAERFKIVDVGTSGPLSSLLSMVPASQRVLLKRASCDGAVWISDAERKIDGMQNLRITMCLFPRRGGYAFDVYAIDTQERGGGLSSIIGRAISNKVVGGPDEWVNKTLFDILRSVRKRAGAKVTYVDGSLEFEGEPWNDSGLLTAADEANRAK